MTEQIRFTSPISPIPSARMGIVRPWTKTQLQRVGLYGDAARLRGREH
jgi:hypothetical protein